MPDLLSLSDFEGHVGEVFRIVVVPGGAVELELIQARNLGTRPNPIRVPFSLIFRGPMTSALPQQIHEMEHETLGPLALFLVPLGPEGDQEGTHYEALFN